MFAVVLEQHLRCPNHPDRIRPCMRHPRTGPAGSRGDRHSEVHRWQHEATIRVNANLVRLSVDFEEVRRQERASQDESFPKRDRSPK